MRVRGFLLAMALVGCGDVGAVHPSPLLAMDADRLWILLQAAKVNPRCREFYAGSTDPRITGLAEKCAEAERRVIAWLEANGVEDAEVEDMREPAFWQWYLERTEEIANCRRQELAKRHVPGSGSVFNGQDACDPYLKIVRVEKRSLSDAGFRSPGD
jgi:hypothetical protein